MKYRIDLWAGFKLLSMEWYKDTKFHRLYGPAIENFDGYRSWLKNDKLHREDGPAREYVDGDKQWFIDGEEYSEEKFLQFSPDFSTI